MSTKSKRDDFEFLESIGEGSYGTVYKVRRKSMLFEQSKKQNNEPFD